MFTEIVDVLMNLLLPETAENQIQKKTCDCGKKNFGPQDLQDRGDPHSLRDKNRQHLIRSGKENCQQGSRGDQTAGIEAGCRRRKAALRHHAGRRSYQWAKPSRFPDDPDRLVSGPVFQIFHGQIRQEQKGKETQGIHQSVQ